MWQMIVSKRSSAVAAGSFLIAATVAQAGVLSVSVNTNAPASSLISQPDFSGAPAGSFDYSDNAGPPAQSFTTLDYGISLTGVTVKGGNVGAGTNNSMLWTLVLSQVNSDNTVTVLAKETSNGFNPNNTSAYLTFTLSTPYTLNANSHYAFAIYSNSGYYAFDKSSTDVYAGGAAFQEGGSSRATKDPSSTTNDTMNNVQSVDRTFYILGTQVVPEPASLGILVLGVLPFLTRRRGA